MIEWIAPGFAYSFAKDVYSWLRGQRRHLTAAEVLELRNKWKPLFEKEILKTNRNDLRQDVIIRDAKRFDNYPDVDDRSKGISPWFRVGLVGTYHKGILAGLAYVGLIQHGRDEWRCVDYRANETSDITVLLTGRIPFEAIQAVDWHGDEYYHYPHIYCHFDAKKKEPYEQLVFCVENCNPGGLPFYTDVASYQDVKKLSRKLGVKCYF